MGTVEPRSNINALTADNLLIGVPFVEFGEQIAVGQFKAYRQLGIVQSAAISKDLEVITLNSAHSGIDSLVREVVRRFEGRLALTVSQFGRENMRLMFGSAADPAAIAAGSSAVVNESQLLPTYPAWVDLAKTIRDGTSFTSLDPTPILAEQIGIGDGVNLAFNLSQKLDGTDIASVKIFLDGVDAESAAGGSFTLVEGTTASPGEIAIDEDAAPAFDGGTRVLFNVADVASIATGVVITADFTSTHTLVENIDFIVDYENARIRRVAVDGAAVILVDNQSVDSDYTTEDFAGHNIEPFTQFTFAGRARVKLLTDIGINMIWPIPLVSLRLNDDDFEFSREEFAEGSLTMTLVDDGTATPFGTMQVYEESAA